MASKTVSHFFPKMLRGWDMRSDMSPCLHFNFVLWQGERRRSLRQNYSVYQNSETRFWRAIPAWYLGQKSADSDRPLLRSIQPKLVFHHQNTTEIWRFLSANLATKPTTCWIKTVIREVCRVILALDMIVFERLGHNLSESIEKWKLDFFPFWGKQHP